MFKPSTAATTVAPLRPEPQESTTVASSGRGNETGTTDPVPTEVTTISIDSAAHWAALGSYRATTNGNPA